MFACHNNAINAYTQCGRGVLHKIKMFKKSFTPKHQLYVELILKQSFFDDYKGDEITIISRTFYIDIGILVVAFCCLYYIFLGNDKVEQKEKKSKYIQVVDKITKS